MSTSFLRGCTVVLALGAVTPALTQGQLPLHPAPGCCQTCYQPPPRCTCTTFHPVVETRLRPTPVTTWREVHETAYRCRARVETVPVVTYQKRIRYETVPYTVTRRVPHCTTVMVPERRVRYVPRQHTYTPGCYTPACPPAAHPGSVGHVGRHVSPAPEPVASQFPIAGSYSDWTDVSSRRDRPSYHPEFLDEDLLTGDVLHDNDEPIGRRRHRRARRDSHRKSAVRAPTAALVWQTPN